MDKPTYKPIDILLTDQRNDPAYCMQLARTAGKKSTCNSRQIGAVIVNRHGRVAAGWNGPEKPMCGDTCPRKDSGYKTGEGLEYCPAVHAEARAITDAAKRGISTWGATLYCSCCVPCKWCAGLIIAAGIKKVVHLNIEPPDNAIHELGTRIFAASDVELVKFCSDHSTN